MTDEQRFENELCPHTDRVCPDPDGACRHMCDAEAREATEAHAAAEIARLRAALADAERRARIEGEVAALRDLDVLFDCAGPDAFAYCVADDECDGFDGRVCADCWHDFLCGVIGKRITAARERAKLAEDGGK